jgi:hypothetical protein
MADGGRFRYKQARPEKKSHLLMPARTSQPAGWDLTCRSLHGRGGGGGAVAEFGLLFASIRAAPAERLARSGDAGIRTLDTRGVVADRGGDLADLVELASRIK